MHPRLKSLLLFLLYAVASNVFVAALGWLLLGKLHLADLRDRTWRPSLFIWWEGIGVAGAFLATWLIVLIGRRRFTELGYAWRGAVRQIAVGSLFGLAAVAALVMAIASLGGFTFGALSMSGALLAEYSICWLVAFFLLGLAEEMDFRAAGLLTLADAIGFWPAALATSLIFAAMHYFLKGPTENIADALSVGLLGFFMCFTVLRTGAIWFAVGFHALFDFAALFLFGAPNSGNGGLPIPTRLLTGGYHGPAWLTGGPLGVEASWLVFPIIAVLFLAFHALYRAPHASIPVEYNPAVSIE